jgi:hypothetical protein
MVFPRSDKYIHPLYCTRTGVALGHLNLTVSAGHIPYISHWEDQICYHPFFSLNQSELIAFMRDEWNRLAKDVVNETITDAESSNLRVGFVALLYSLGSIQQDNGVTIFPSLGVVQSNLESLTTLAYWKNYLDSKRFAFPEYHFSRINNNADLSGIHAYLEDCWQKKKDYENGINDLKEQEKARIAEKAILAIRNQFLKIPSKKLLWQWVQSNLSKKWQPDAEGWLRTLFLSTVSKSLDFEIEDIELMEEIIVSECPIGNSVMFAVKERINEIKNSYKQHYDHFLIEEDGLAFIEGLRQEHEALPEPQEKDYPSKGAFFVARAKWQLANPVQQPAKVVAAIESAKNKLSYRSEDL